MSEQVDMVEVKTEPNESDELFSDGENTNMVDNNSIQDEVTSESKNQLNLNEVYNKFCFYYIKTSFKIQRYVSISLLFLF